MPHLFLYFFILVAVSPSSPQTAPSCFKNAWQKNFIKKFLDLSAITTYKNLMTKYILNMMPDRTYEGNSKQIVEKLYADTQAYFPDTASFRKGFAESACDWSGKPMRYGSDEELVEDLIEYKVLVREK